MSKATPQEETIAKLSRGIEERALRLLELGLPPKSIERMCMVAVEQAVQKFIDCGKG